MKNSLVIITGCDSGFGNRLVERILRETELYVLACFHSQSGAEKSQAGERLIKIILEITDDTSVGLLKKRVEELSIRFKFISLVNNAGGLVVSGPIEWSSMRSDIAQMDLNFFGTVRVTKALLPLIRKSRGRIINVSSILGLVASPLGGLYAASKFAIEGWSDALRREMLPFGVRVCLIEPGMFTGTKFYSKYTDPVVEGFKSLGEITRDDYGEDYRDYCVKRLVALQQHFGNEKTDMVVETMLHALNSSFPKHRYRVGTDCRFLARILQWLPSSFGDIALVCADCFVTLDRSLVPVLPSRAAYTQWYQMAWFSIASYNNDRLILVLVIFIIILVSA
jgi:NAD(P)-dependent dehydrogenase (short-subunit alcohol dehydrogenase family)